MLKVGKIRPPIPPVTLSSHFHSDIAPPLRDVTFCFYFPSIPLRVSQKTTSFWDHSESGESWLPTMVRNLVDFFRIFWNREIVVNCPLRFHTLFFIRNYVQMLKRRLSGAGSQNLYCTEILIYYLSHENYQLSFDTLFFIRNHGQYIHFDGKLRLNTET